MIEQITAAFFGTILFAIVFNVSRKELFFCGLTGGIGWFIYLLAFQGTQEVVLSSFIAAVVISWFSLFLAKARKNPVTVYQIGGIFPLVPGAGMYRTLYYVVSEDYVLSTRYLYETIQIAGSIAVGMIFVAALHKIRSRKRV